VWRVPGIGLAKEPTFESYVVANVVFLVGVFTFAVMLGEVKQSQNMVKWRIAVDAVKV
jgi:hypothetical protein